MPISPSPTTESYRRAPVGCLKLQVIGIATKMPEKVYFEATYCRTTKSRHQKLPQIKMDSLNNEENSNRAQTKHEQSHKLQTQFCLPLVWQGCSYTAHHWNDASALELLRCEAARKMNEPTRKNSYQWRNTSYCKGRITKYGNVGRVRGPETRWGEERGESSSCLVFHCLFLLPAVYDYFGAVLKAARIQPSTILY